MLMDDLRAYGQGNRDLDRKIRNKCQADLVYYMAIQEVLRDYGLNGARNMKDIDPDALCIARDQMAALASDDGLLRYDGDNRVEGFYNPGSGRYDRSFTDASLRHFVRETFLNCEALRAMVSTSLASRPAYRGQSMTDDEFEALVQREIDTAVLNESDPDSPLNRVLANASTFGDTMGVDPGRGMFSFGIPEERLVRDSSDSDAILAADQARATPGRKPSPGSVVSAHPGRAYARPGEKIMVLDHEGRPNTIMGLKLSPLMPEFKTLRALGSGNPLGLYHDAAGHARNPMDGPELNSVLMFDAQKRFLTVSPVSGDDYYKNYLSQAKGLELRPSNGILFGPSDYVRNQSYQYVSTRYTNNEYMGEDGLMVSELDLSSASRSVVSTSIYDNAGQNDGLRMVHGWKMAQVILGHSGQDLTDKDYGTIRKIMATAQGSTLFGDLGTDGEAAVQANAGAYFAYLDHVCGSVASRMPAHEFGIHFEEQNYFADKDGLVPLLYFTGERGGDYNRARSNPARYFGFYPFARYKPANIDVSPIAGDIAPAAYNSFTITDMNHRRSATDPSLQDPEKNRYANVTRIDEGMCRDMRNVFDDYMNGPRRGFVRSGVQVVKIRRRVGDTGLGDLSEFIRPDGSVDGPMIAKVLIEDMNAIKAVQREEFLSPSNQDHMRGIFELFTERNSPDGTGRLGDAMAMFYDSTGASTADEFGEALSEELGKCMNLELREAYGQDINAFAAMRHIYRSYLGDFASQCVAKAAMDAGGVSRRDVMPALSDMPSAFDNDAYDGFAGGIIQAMSDPDDITLDRALRELYGSGELEEDGRVDPDVPQRVIIKANMCRYSSTQFLYQDYSDLLKLLSYSNYASYEPDMGRDLNRVMDGLDANTPVGIQLYASEAYGLYDAGDYDDASVDEVRDDDRDDGDRDFHSASDDKLWFDSVFSDAGYKPRTLAWLDADHSGQAERYTGDWREYPRADHAVFEATHPLQCAALRRCGAFLSRTEPDFDPERLSISGQGAITYTGPDGSAAFRIGPFIDEEAYIRPQVIDDPEGVEIERAVLNQYGFPVRDGNGTSVTEKARVRSLEGIEIDGDGRLVNQVTFGALDRRSVMPDGQAQAAQNNRFYGVSARVAPYDGYAHDGRSYIDRMQFSTYQMSVMENLERSLSLYLAARNGDGKDGIARSLFYTNTGAASLQKCYQTNTYLIDSKAKAGVAGSVLRGYMDMGLDFDDIYPDGSANDDGQFEMAMRVADLHMTQGQAYRTRVVFPKIETSQNIGLYNQAVNLHQCLVSDSGRLDVKSMRDTDSKGARVAMFQPNIILDPVISGSAKQLGAVGQLTDAVRIDRMTGRIETDPDTEAQTSGGEAPNTRMPFISQGVESFETGGVTNLEPHSGGQAFDRQQLSTAGALKSLNVAQDLRFAMVNLGYNMEDGYIVAKHAAYKLGHFEEDGRYTPLQKWDKIGDTESGNKGVVAKIVDTDIGAGMDDASADDEFLARYLYQYLQTEGVNHGGADGSRMAVFWDSVQAGVDRYFGNGQPVGLREAFCSASCPDGRTVGDNLDELRQCMLPRNRKKQSYQDRADDIRDAMYQGLKPYLIDIGRDLDANGVQPFSGTYRAERAVWQIFRDNPSLEVTVTNVCVCTRSNPSILMNIGEACDRDRDAMERAGVRDEDADRWLLANGESVLTMRDDDGMKIPVMGAVGRMSVYVDSHTADDKNKDYNQSATSPKAGRRIAAQEIYALQGERCCDAFMSFMAANDPAMPDNIAKLNRRAMMNGFLFDLNTDNISCRRTASLDGVVLHEAQGSGGMAYQSDSLCGFGFVDMSVLAKTLASHVRPGTGQDAVGAAVTAMSEDLDFSKLLSLKYKNQKDMQGSPKSIDDKLRYMFASAFGKDGGAYMLLPESLFDAAATADIGVTKKVDAMDELTGHTYSKTVPDPVQLDFGTVMPDGSVRRAAPLFMSSREIANPDAELVTAPVDDRMQFKLFKTVLAAAVVDELYRSDLIPAGAGHDRVPMLSEPARDAAKQALSERFTKAYASVPNERSLDLGNMNAWTKKNLYYLSMQDSMTCVWAGDPTLSVDEVGMSFEKAKSMGILKPKKDMSPDDLRKIPDTYEFMSERYEALDDDDLVVINRSPGQTTGCIRALHPKITGPEGGGISVHPAVATIFDGDFDGDTIGNSNPFAPRGLDKNSEDYENMSKAARDELLERMSMQGNMVHEADYTDIDAGDGSCIKNVHPLFIAGNADYAVAKHNMSKKTPDGRPVCGYDISREVDSVTVMANMLYELRNCAYDFENAMDSRITMGSARNIISARQEQIASMAHYFDAMDDASGTERDQAAASGWKSMTETFRKLNGGLDGFLGRGDDGIKALLAGVTDMESMVFEKFRGVYDDMAGHISSHPLMTHGRTQHEILYNIIHDANISKKGKEPQLNALLSYSSVGTPCGGSLSVCKNDEKKFELMKDGRSCTDFDPDIRMSNGNPVSDVPKSPFRTQIESHTVAQSDKSDATGMGGAMAQKMQKIFSPAGYGAFGLRISGPITQSYLDAKQNVTKCGNNLKIGKFVLDSVAKFQKFDEFTDTAMSGADLTQIFRGQYTKSTATAKNGRAVPVYMTVEECVSQMDNFIQVMGHPGFTNIDKAIASAVLSKYESEEKGTERKIVKDPVKSADKTGDATYAIMYGSDNGFAEMMAHMAEHGRGLFDGSFGFDGKIDTERLRERTAQQDGAALADGVGRALEDHAAEARDAAAEKAASFIRERQMVLESALSAEESRQVLSGYSTAPDADDCKGAYDKVKQICDVPDDGGAGEDEAKKESTVATAASVDDILGSF